MTNLSPDGVHSEATVLLENFHKVRQFCSRVQNSTSCVLYLQIVSHGVHPDSQIERALTMVCALKCCSKYTIPNHNKQFI